MKRMFLPLAVVTVIMSLVLIGCGGGGGGGEGGNPVATTAEAQLVSVTGEVLLSDQPQSGVIVSLRSSAEAELAGLAELHAARASQRGQLLPSTVSTENRVTTTDTNGVYRFDGVPEGEYTLQAENPETRKKAVITRLVLSAVKGAVTTQNAELQPTSDIAGTISVSGHTGSLAGGRVYLAGTSFLALTDSAGNFRIAYVPTGTDFSLMADFGGAVLSSPIPIQSVAGSTSGNPALTSPLVLTAPVTPTVPTGNISGMVTRAPFAAGDTDHGGTLVSLTQAGKLVTFTETSPTGAYAFTGVLTAPSNIYNIRFMAPNYVVPATPLSVTVPADGTVTAPAVTLAPRLQIATIGRFYGRVQKQAKYDPAETDSIQMFLATGTTPANAVRYIQISDQNGYFSFAGIPVGEYSLGCADPRYALTAPAVVQVTSAGNTTPPVFMVAPTLQIAMLGSVSGIATKIQKYDPAETESVQLFIATGTTPADSRKYFQVSNPNGTFAFAGIPVGSYQLGCADPDYALQGAPIVQVSSPTNAIPTSFSLAPARPIVVLGGLTGQIVRSRYIGAEPSTDLIPLRIATGTPGTIGYFEKLTVTDSNGYFSITGIPVGTYTLFCGDRDYVFDTAEQTVPVTATVSVLDHGQLVLIPNPNLEATGVLVGTITTSLTTPTRVILLAGSPVNNRETYAVPVVAGALSFRVAGLVPGNYSLHLDQETGWDIDPMRPTNSVTVDPNAVASQTFETISILPTITDVATSATDITVNGTNLNPNYRIQVSHLGQEPWQILPFISFTDPNLVGNSSSLMGGRYKVQVAIPSSEVLIANWPTELLIPPHPVLSATTITRPDSITVSWPSVAGISQYKAVLRTTTPSTFVREVTTTAPTAVFSGLEPATSYNIELYTVVDGVFSSVYPLTAILTQGVQMEPLTASFPYALQGASFPNNPNMLVASGGVLYFLEGDTYPQSLSSLDTTTGATQSVTLGSVMSTSKIFSGSAGLYVIQQESLNQVIQQYDPANLTPKPVSYTVPADNDLFLATYCAATGHIYCLRVNTSLSPVLATMTVLFPGLTPDGPETSLSLPGVPSNTKLEASRDGSTVGFTCDFSGDGPGGTLFQGFFTSTRTLAAPMIYPDGKTIVSLQGGSNGSLFVFSTGDGSLLEEYKPTLNKQFAISSERLFLPGMIQFDGNLNRWFWDYSTLTAYDAAYSPTRVFNLTLPPDILCYDPVARTILQVSSTGTTIEIGRFDADF